MRRKRLTSLLVAATLLASACTTNPAAPRDNGGSRGESIVVEQLPLPPTAPRGIPQGCTPAVNPNNTGCLSAGRDGIRGLRAFTWDSRHLLVGVTFAGAAPDSPFRGPQLILVKTDGQTFDNGDGWRCLSCEVTPERKVGMNDPDSVSYPEAFRDNRRVKFGNNVLDCGPVDLADCDARAETTHIYPIRSPFPAGAATQMRELRLHPDNVHLGWNQLFLSDNRTEATQFGVIGTMSFNPAADPPTYEVRDVRYLLSPDPQISGRFVSVSNPPNGTASGELQLDEPAGVIGEFRGFTSDGTAALGIGTQDSWNWDVFATSLQSGESRRLSRDPAYTDPVSMSPDDRSLVLADGRVDNDTGRADGNPVGSDGRMYFAAALPGVPPLIDLAISGAIGNLYNNQYGSVPGVPADDPTTGRRFFAPYLIDIDEEPADGIHDGRLLTAGADTTPGNGSISDPLWNVGADPAWSPDGTSIAFYQLLVGPPACADTAPEPDPCPVSREPGGRMSRLMIARLTDRDPAPPRPQPAPVTDPGRWGVPYREGDPLPPSRPQVPAGTYILRGQSGTATVTIAHHRSSFDTQGSEVSAVEVSYDDYSSDGQNFLNGRESGRKDTGPLRYVWHSDLTLSGRHTGSKKTSEPQGFIVESPGLAQPPTIAGALTTELDGMTFTSPITGS